MSQIQVAEGAFPYFDKLPEQIKRDCQSDSLTRLIEYFRKNSLISRLLMKNPGTFKMLEIVYTGQRLQGDVDEFLLGSLPAQALKNRLEAIISFLTNQFQRIVVENGKVKVVNLGCGSARDLVVTIARVPEIVERISAECVDIDPEALETAQTLADQENISLKFRFTRANLTQLVHQNDLDLGLLVGILCGLEHRQCVIILRKIKRYFKKGGIVVASNVLTTMLEKDEFFVHVLGDIIGWELVYKTSEELQSIFEEAGYEWGGIFYDEPTRFHGMGIGIVPLI